MPAPPVRSFICLILGWRLGYQLTVNTADYPAGTYKPSLTADTGHTTAAQALPQQQPVPGTGITTRP